MNIFAIGDIHGCLNELTLLHKKILTHDKFNAKEDLLVYLGDYIDRGLNSKHVIDQIIKIKNTQIKTVMLMGNHEEMMIDFLFNKNNNINITGCSLKLIIGIILFAYAHKSITS